MIEGLQEALIITALANSDSLFDGRGPLSSLGRVERERYLARSKQGYMAVQNALREAQSENGS